MDRNLGIVGSKGFIGNHLCRALTSQNIRYAVFEGDALRTHDVEAFLTQSAAREIVFLIGSFDPPMNKLNEKNLRTLQTVLEGGVTKGL